jgi:TPR repeat protein
LGLRIEKGDGFDQDPAEGVRWIRVAAEGGLPEARLELSWRYRTGRGVEMDSAEATRLLREAAEGGTLAARLELALRHRTGLEVPADRLATNRWLLAAVMAHPPADGFEAPDSLAKDEWPPSNPSGRFMRLMAAMDAAWPAPEGEAGIGFDHGGAPPVDRAEARLWLQAIGGSGHPDTKALWTIFFEKDHGEEESQDLVLQNFRIASEAGLPEAGLPEAQAALAALYQRGGDGVEKDPAKAIPLLESAAWAGNTFAKYSLGRS